MLDPADGWRRTWQEDLTLETDLKIHSTDDHSSYCSKPPNRVTLQDVFGLDYLTLFVIVNVNEPWREKAIEVSGKKRGLTSYCFCNQSLQVVCDS